MKNQPLRSHVLNLLWLLLLACLAAVAGAQSHAAPPCPARQLALPTGTLPAASLAPDAPAKSIPFDQLGAAAQKQYSGEGISISPTAEGARL